MALVGDMNYLTINGDTYEIADADARQELALKAPIASPVFTGTPTAPTPGGSAGDTEIATVKYVQDAVSGVGTGTVTSVGVSNATNGGLSVSGSPITTNGTITIGHSNVLTSAQTTQAVYPIKIDKNGHISSYGSAVTIPDVSGKIDTAGTGLSKSGTTLNHSNSVTAQTTQAVYPIKIDAQGHISDYGSAVNVPTKVSELQNDSGFTTNTGTVTSVQVQATSPVQSSTSTAQSTSLNTTISLADAYGDTKNPYGVKAATYVLAGPTSGSDAAPTFRALVASDIPDLSGTYSTTDEKLKWTASTSSNTYYPIASTSTATTSTANTLNGINYYQYYNTAGGYRRLVLGNSTAWKSSGGAYGTIRLYGSAATYYGDLVPGVLGTTSGDGHISANRTWTLPDNTGTLALTSDIPTVPTNVSSFTNDAGYTTNTGTVTSVTLKAGSGISLDIDDTAITTSGTRTISHSDTSSQSSSSNSGRTYIQSVTLDDYGHVTGLSTATETVTNTDTKLQVAAVTSGATYYPIVGTGTTAATRQYDSTGFVYDATTSTTGYARVTLGNSTAQSTSGSKYGQLRLYGTTAYATTLVSGSPTASRTITLPNATGTVALTSDIPTIPDSTENSETGISIANHSTGSVTGVQSATTSVRGVKTGTSSTTTASKASGSNSTVPTLGDPISIIGVQSSTTSVTGVQASTTTASKVTVGTSSTDYGVTAAGSGSFTSGAFNGGSGSFTATVTNHVLSFSHTHTAATHGADSHTHTAPTLGSKIPTVSASDVTVPIKATSATTVPIKATSATEIPNVTSVGSASTWSFTDVTVPIRADSDTTVPIKDASASTFVTSTTHTITDNGHTHSI